jgi:hypothetical protein
MFFRSVLWGADTHKAGVKDENILVWFYYKCPGVLFLCVLGAESYSCGFYWMLNNPDIFNNIIFKISFILAAVVFHFKQVL